MTLHAEDSWGSPEQMGYEKDPRVKQGKCFQKAYLKHGPSITGNKTK